MSKGDEVDLKFKLPFPFVLEGFRNLSGETHKLSEPLPLSADREHSLAEIVAYDAIMSGRPCEFPPKD
jgi:hypothetical protein